MNRFYAFFLVLSGFSLPTFIQAKMPPELVYSQIKDIRHPTLADYEFVQKHLIENGIVTTLGDEYVDRNLRNLKIIGDPPSSFQSGVIAINCDADDKENCLILYSTFNQNYARGVKRLIRHMMSSDFKGHILYQIGGWPNTAEGDLTLAHVPYAFKVCAFREAKRLGYKRAFWLDSPAIPIISINDVFKYIQREGYFVFANEHYVGPYMNAKAAQAFGLTLEETYGILSCQAGIFGVDFSDKKAAAVIDLWYQAAKDKDAFYSLRSDQNALSIILYQQGLTNFIPYEARPAYFHWLR